MAGRAVPPESRAPGAGERAAERERHAPAPDAPGTHLAPEDLYGLIEGNLSRRKLRAAEDHLDSCADCIEALAMVLRAERPATRDEQELLARTPERATEDLLAALRPRIDTTISAASNRRGFEWKPIVMSVVVATLLFSGVLLVRARYWWPASSRRAASDALETLVELRQATGRVPLRYITEFERAGVVRSGFDTTDAAEEALVSNLRAAVERAPEPEAVITLGLLLLDAGELVEAERLLEQGRAAIPDSIDAINGLAVLYFLKAEYFPDEAYAIQQRGLALLRQAEAIDPEDLRVLFNYGKLYEVLGMRSAEVRAWRRYLENDQVSQWAEEAARQLVELTPSTR